MTPSIYYEIRRDGSGGYHAIVNGETLTLRCRFGGGRVANVFLTKWGAERAARRSAKAKLRFLTERGQKVAEGIVP